jgi:hypothetical protein
MPKKIIGCELHDDHPRWASPNLSVMLCNHEVCLPKLPKTDGFAIGRRMPPELLNA